MPRETKQVIIIRKDLNMRKGKCVAQGAHASLGSVFHMQLQFAMGASSREHWIEPYNDWKEGTFTKICVSVDSEQELFDIYKTALNAELPVKRITDSGKTEFGNVPTDTCIAIGPYWADEIDKITGHLKLL